MVKRFWLPWMYWWVGENTCPWMTGCSSLGGFEVVFRLCWDLGNLGVECWHEISCSVAQILCLLYVVCLCKVMWHQQWLRWCFQAEVGRIQRPAKSVYCPGCMKGVLHKRLYEMCDIVWKLIGRAVTCWNYCSKWYVWFVGFREAIEEWSRCRLEWG